MRLVVIFVALVVALVFAVTISGVLEEDKPQRATSPAEVRTIIKEAKVHETTIYVASQDIAIGQEVSPNDYDVKAWPTHLLPPNPIIVGEQGALPVEGQIASAPIYAGEPLLGSKLRNKNDPSFISGQLEEGQRAVTISVTLTDSVAGFVNPGDVVDVLYTFDINKAVLDTGDVTATTSAEAERVSVSETLLAGVKILAVDQRVLPGAAVDQNGQVISNPIPTSVTLAVAQLQAQKLKLAERMGNLTLALRSIADSGDSKVARPSAEQDLTRLLPPAYFPALFNNDLDYDYSVIDLYGGGPRNDSDDEDDDSSIPEESPFSNVKVYRGVDLERMEVKRP